MPAVAATSPASADASANTLAGRTALLTGASSGIGRALALALAEAGVHLCLVGRDANRLEATAEQARQQTPVVVTIYCELTDDAAVRALPAALLPPFTHLDFLIHAAGTAAHGLLADHPLAELDRQFAINVRAPYLLTQVLLPRLRPHSGGSVVFINSMAAFLSRAVNSQYSATKAALKALADSLREELAPVGVRVLSVYPGRTATPLMAQLCASQGEHYDASRYIRPVDLAGLVLVVLRLPTTALVYDLPVRSVYHAPIPVAAPAVRAVAMQM